MSTLKCFLGWSNFATNQFLAYCPLVGNWDVLKILKVHLIHETYRKPVQQTLDLWFCFLKNHAKYVVTQLLFFGQRSWGLFLKDLRSNPSPLSICTWILQFSSLKYRVWWTGFFPSLNWIFLPAVAWKIQVWNSLKIKFIKLNISNWTIAKIECR